MLAVAVQARSFVRKTDNKFRLLCPPAAVGLNQTIRRQERYVYIRITSSEHGVKVWTAD